MLAAPTAATADELPVKACVEASDAGQTLRDHGKLKEARAAFARCAGRECPAEISADCGTWFFDAEQRIPSIVVTVRDGDGADVTSARVLIDGKAPDVRGTALGGRIELDPGRHVLHVTVGDATREVSFVLSERDKARPVTIVLPTRRATYVRPTPVLSYVFGATALVATGLGVGFGASALSTYGDLQATCPRCSDADRDLARTQAVVADVALGVGVVSAALATILFLTRPTVRVAPEARPVGP